VPITAERLEVDVEANTSKAKRDLDQFDSSVQRTTSSTNRATRSGSRMGGAFKMASGMIASAAGAMVGALGVKAVMAASDLNEEVSKAGVVFGPQANIVTGAADEMARKFGIVKSEFIGAASGIGLVAKASGMTQKAAASLGADMGRLAADASSFYNVPVTEALDAMKSGLVGEAEPMRRFGVLLSEAAVKNEAYRLGIAKTGAELTEGQKVQARSSLIMKGMTDASGDLARTQSSVANRLREVKGRATNFAAEMGKKALPAVEWFLGAVIKAPKVIGGMIQSVREYLTTNKSWKPIMDAAKAGLNVLLGALKAAPGVFRAVVGAVREFMNEHKWVKPLLDQIGVAVAGFVAGFMAVMAIQKVIAVIKGIALAIRIMSAAMMANPIGLVVAALVALGFAVYAAYKRFEPFRNLVNSVASALKNGFTAAIDWVVKKWGQLKELPGKAKAALGNAKTALVQKGAEFLVGLWNGLQSRWSAVVGWVKAIPGRVKSAIGNAAGFLVSKGVEFITGLWNGIKNRWNAVKGWFSSMPGKVKGFLSGAASWLRDAGVQIITGLWEGLKSKWEEVKGWFGNITDSIPDLKGPRSKDRQLLIENGQAIMEGLKEGLNREWREVKGLFKAMTKWVESAAFPDDMEKRVEKRIRKVSRRVERLTKKAQDLAAKYEAAVQEHADKVEAKASFRESTFSGMNSQANVMNAGNTGAAIAASLQAQVAKVAQFGSDVAALAARGLNRDAIAQITAAGVDGGSQVAAALAQATDAELASINASYAAIGAQATSTADTLAANLHDAGIGAAQAVVDGLEARQDKVKKTLRTIAQSMIEEVQAIVSKAIAAEKAAQKAAQEKADAAAKDTGKAAGGKGGTGGPDKPGKPGERPGGASGGPSRGPKPSAMGQGKADRGGVAFHFTVNNPKDEPTSRSTNKALDRAASLGLV